jgi:hypothetical protein
MVKTHAYPYSAAVLILAFIGCASNTYSQKIFDISDHQNISLTPPSKKINAVIDTRSRKHKVAANKTYYWYDNIAIHETKGGYSGYLLDGVYKEFSYPGNDLVASGKFQNGLKDGIWTHWYENRHIKERSNWKNGKLNGKKYTYNDQGELSSIETYKHGSLNGKKTVFISDTLEKNTYYRHGEMKDRRNFLSTKDKNDARRKIKPENKPLSAKNSEISKNKKTLKVRKKNSQDNIADKETKTPDKKKMEKTRGKNRNRIWGKVKNIF